MTFEQPQAIARYQPSRLSRKNRQTVVFKLFSFVFGTVELFAIER